VSCYELPVSARDLVEALHREVNKRIPFFSDIRVHGMRVVTIKEQEAVPNVNVLSILLVGFTPDLQFAFVEIA
jgi:hypothetical protein